MIERWASLLMRSMVVGLSSEAWSKTSRKSSSLLVVYVMLSPTTERNLCWGPAIAANIGALSSTPLLVIDLVSLLPLLKA